MLPTTDPADVVRAVADGVTRLVTARLTGAERDALLDSLAGLYAEHTDVRHPFAPLGGPVLHTRAELRAHFAAAGGPLADEPAVERFDWADGVMHRTADPEVVIFEFVRVVRVHGREATVPSIYVVRVRDGRIVESRDYADHVGLSRVLGRLEDLARALLAGVELPPDDHRAITELVARHGHLIDDGELDRLDELFTPHAVYDVSDLGGGELHGPTGVRQAAIDLGDGNPVAHHVTNVVVTPVDQDAARVCSKGLGVTADGRVGSVTYLDTVVRTADGWRITHRVVRARREPLNGIATDRGPAAR